MADPSLGSASFRDSFPHLSSEADERGTIEIRIDSGTDFVSRVSIAKRKVAIVISIASPVCDETDVDVDHLPMSFEPRSVRYRFGL